MYEAAIFTSCLRPGGLILYCWGCEEEVSHLVVLLHGLSTLNTAIELGHCKRLNYQGLAWPIIGNGFVLYKTVDLGLRRFENISTLILLRYLLVGAKLN